jgi:alpha-tubulin suppressor-like RCC1 family protein
VKPGTSQQEVAMIHIACTLSRRLAPLLGPALVVVVLGCREEAESPTAPGPEPALDITPAAALSFRQVSAGTGGLYTCAVTTDDRAYCWGQNHFGQLGNGTSDFRAHPRPVPVAGGHRFVRVDAGALHTCGVTTDNRAFCWGRNDGALGDGTITDRLQPVDVAGGRRFRQMNAGHFHTCGLTTFDVAFCWGFNGDAELGDGTLTRRLLPVRVVGVLQFTRFSVGGRHNCGLTEDDRAYCWGANFDGQLGDGTTSLRLTPGAVASQLRFLQVSAGNFHTCAVNPFNRVFCWGLNDEGQLGDSTTTQRLTPVRIVHRGLRFRQVSAGGSHTCGVTTDDLAYCWGLNDLGQLGDGTTKSRLTPVAVAGGHRFVRVDAGSLHTCAVTTSHRAFCWGNNSDGQLGDGTTQVRLRPVAVSGPS